MQWTNEELNRNYGSRNLYQGTTYQFYEAVDKRNNAMAYASLVKPDCAGTPNAFGGGGPLGSAEKPRGGVNGSGIYSIKDGGATDTQGFGNGNS